MNEINNLIKLENFEIENIQQVLKDRFNNGIIYTNCGRILISLNPFKDLGIYNEEHLKKYHNEIGDENLQPHVFQFAENAYQNMFEEDTNQAILISGESGSGKTEISKHVLRKIMYQRNQANYKLEEKINMTNDILESFGNARTKLNWNSSRFGKLTEVFFDKDGKVRRAIIKEYMLEKSRLIKQNVDESNFHILYAFFEGANLSDYKLSKEKNYKIFSNVHKHSLPTTYQNIIRCLKELDFYDGDIEKIETSLAAIIHLTEIIFEGDAGVLHITTKEAVSNVAQLLGLDSEQFSNVLLKKKLISPVEELEIVKSKKQAEEQRDAFAKSLYTRLFEWVIAKMNSFLSNDQTTEKMSSINILDMSGFERLNNNSFEQFVINFTNEKLQIYLEKHIFSLEIELYKEEEVQLTFNNINYQSNEGILNLFENSPTTLFSIIDEETHFPEANNNTLLTKLNNSFKEHKCYEINDTNGFFTIKHFAGKVTYAIDSFLIKNRDEICYDLKMYAKQSRNTFFSRLFKADRDLTGSIVGCINTLKNTGEESGIGNIKEYNSRISEVSAYSPQNQTPRGKGTNTVISYMQNSLKLLVQKLDHSKLHFIRCIRSNSTNKEDFMEEDLVKKQLLYTGIAHAAEMCKTGYPNRKTYSEFLHIFSLSKYCKPTEEKDKVVEMLKNEKINPSGYCLGNNMIFLKDSAYFALRKKQKAYSMEIESKTTESDDYADISELPKHSISSSIDNTTEVTDIMEASCEEYTKFDFSEETPYNSIRDTEPSISSQQLETNKNKISDSNLIRSPPPNKRTKESISLQERMKNTVSVENINSPLGLKKGGVEDIYNQIEETTKYPWDIFEMFEEDPERDEIQHSKFIIVVKIFLYLLFFLIILTSSVIQKLTLTLIVQFYAVERKVNHEQNTSFSLLSIAICIPYGIGFIISTHKFLFNSDKRCNTAVLALILFPETLHSVGLTVFLFHIFPLLDIFVQIVMLNSIGIIPGLFKLLFTQDVLPENSATRKQALLKFKDLSIFICHVAALVVLLAFTDELSLFRKVEAFICILLVSVNSWENFFDKCNFSNELNDILINIKVKLNKRNSFESVIAYIWKILLTLLIGYLLTFQDYGSKFKNLEEIKILFISPFLAIILLTTCTAVGYYVAYQTCSLRMQKFSYSAALLLSTPVTFAAYFVMNELDDVPNVYKKYFTMNKFIALGCGAVIYITFYIIVSHIWFPKTVRLQRHENLFQKTIYCPLFFEQSLVLDRRRHIISTKERINDDESVSPDKSFEEPNNAKKIYPMVYACATMWHETENEMMQLLKSLFRMAIDQTLQNDMKNVTKRDNDFYQCEGHIFFDDAMYLTENNDVMVNKYVQTFVSLIDKAASSVMKTPVKLPPPCKILTPYGGQLLWQLQDDVLLFVHLKDKKKIRNKKRWSQVMYMYYLLAFRLPKFANERLMEKLGFQTSIDDLDKMINEEMNALAENTFILALDGDVDFYPDAVEKLVDLMKNDEKLGAACGRIHPMGNGPMIWFQIFEYAIGHWYQKATEHILGCVLCSPGCFSLFRGSALMNMNVARKYTIIPTEARHHLQFDQGEDRWLCTLLLQQGYKIGYSAASDAYTFAPESFNEFFNQRRRWMPSTIANILDLLGSYKLTIQKNDNVSFLFILYQLVIMILTIIGPATVMMMIAMALDTVFSLGVPLSYLLVLIPNMLYVIACFYLNTKTQLILASIQAAVYTFIMLAVIVGIIITAGETSLFHPEVVVILSMSALIIFSGLLHLQEIFCLICGLIYFLCIPLAYLTLVVYSMCNMHVVSWGTREVKETPVEEAKAIEKKLTKDNNSYISKLGNMLGISEMSMMVKSLFNMNKNEDKMLVLLKEMNENIKSLSNNIKTQSSIEHSTNTLSTTLRKSKVTFNDSPEIVEISEIETPKKKKSSTKFWIRHPSLGDGQIAKLSKDEYDFWQQFIVTYLYPLKPTLEEERKAKEDLLEFRTNGCYALILLNLLWMVINFMLQYRKPVVISFEEDVEVDIFSFVFLIVYGFIFLIQFFGMLLHRLETFFHIISSTNITSKRLDHLLQIPDSIKKAVFRKLRYNIMYGSQYQSIHNYAHSFEITAAEYMEEEISKPRKSLRNTLRQRHISTIVEEENNYKNVAKFDNLAMSTRHIPDKKKLGNRRQLSKKEVQQIKSRTPFLLSVKYKLVEDSIKQD